MKVFEFALFFLGCALIASAFYLSISFTNEQIDKCHAAGGVYTRNICFSPKAVIDLRGK